MSLFVRTFMTRFAPLVEQGTKCQTARRMPVRMPKLGQTFSARTWTGKPYRSKQRLLKESPITSFAPIKITPQQVYIDGIAYTLEEFAIDDGFSDQDDMLDFFQPTSSTSWEGLLICWI